MNETLLILPVTNRMIRRVQQATPLANDAHDQHGHESNCDMLNESAHPVGQSVACDQAIP